MFLNISFFPLNCGALCLRFMIGDIIVTEFSSSNPLTFYNSPVIVPGDNKGNPGEKNISKAGLTTKMLRRVYIYVVILNKTEDSSLRLQSRSYPERSKL